METFKDTLYVLREDISTWLSNADNSRMLLVSGTAFLASGYVIQCLRASPGGKQPPGPWYLPVLGNFIMFTNNKYLYRTVEKLRNDYGDLCYVRVGPYPCVIVSGARMIRKMFVDNKEMFSNRANVSRVDRYIGVGKGLVKSSYEDNKINRKNSMKALRKFGFGSPVFEEKMKKEADNLVCEMLALNNAPFDPSDVLTKAVANIIFQLVINKRYENDDPKFTELLENINTQVEKFGMGFRGLSFLPVWILKIVSGDIRKCFSSYNEINKYIRHEIEENLKIFDNNNINSFVDLYIQMSQENKDDSLIDNLREIILDFLCAGVETTNTTLRFFVFFMCKYPDVQKKCREEILEEIGGSIRPCLADRSKLLYNNATQLELLRMISTAPVAITHTCDTDVTLDGYHYEKNTMFMPNLYCCHMNEKTFPQPHEFKPERWIGVDGKLINPPPDYMPFGVGPRSCIGDALAKNEIFIFTVSMLQRLTFSYDGEIPVPDIQMGITMRIAQQLRIIVKPIN